MQHHAPSTQHSGAPIVRRSRLALAFLFAAAVMSLAGAGSARAAEVYWGSYIDGKHYGYATAPWDTRTFDLFEANAGKRMSIMHYGQPWYWGSRGGYQPFQRDTAEKTRLRGTIPMITWTSEDLDVGRADQPNFQLLDIINGQHDAYIRQWARDAKAWGYPMFVRFDHEMNGNWFVWSERRNGNSPGEFARMWQHVVDIFRQEGASNVTWVWAPNRTWAAAPSTMASVYPGASYVDWTGVSAYNWGTNPAKPNNAWQNFDAVFKETYDSLRALAPGKPIMITETASSEYGGSKAAWIKDALETKLPTAYPEIQALVWFNWNCPATYGPMDWVIETSSTAKAAFAAGIASNYYAANRFAALPKLTKVQPLSSASAPPPPPPPPASVPVNTVTNPSFETIGTPWYAPWTVRNDLGASFVPDTNTFVGGSKSLRVSLPRTSSQPWAVQVRQARQPLVAGAAYTLSFSAKASAARPLNVVLQRGSSPWTVYADRNANVSTVWSKYTYTFTAPVTDAAAMLTFNLAQSASTLWLDEVTLTRQ